MTKTRSRKEVRRRELERARAEARRVERQRRHRRAAAGAVIAVIGLVGVAVIATRALNTPTAASATANDTTTTAAAPSSTAATAPTTAGPASTRPAAAPSSHRSTTPPANSTTTAPHRTAPKTPANLTATQVQAAYPKGLLIDRPAPKHATTCNNHPTPTPTTTVPASGNRVSIVPAPTGIGFPNLSGTSPRYTHFNSPPPFCINPNATYRATIHTDLGPITLTLLPKAAPLAVNNFVFLAGYHYYDNIIFQRVVPHYLDQAGDPLGTGYGGPGYTFKNELPHSAAAYLAGTVGMANAGPNTNGSQFFIATANLQGHIPNHYTVFAAVTHGMNVVDAINHQATPDGKPTTIHRITNITITRTQ